jgi:hypothetical protein
MEDQFRPIEGYPGYRVSRDREVLSCWKRRGRRGTMTDAWLPLTPIRKSWGHLYVNLVRSGVKRARPVHRFVLEAFVGPCPPGCQCCHWDGVATNNRVANLRWGTPKDNADDTLRHGRRAVGAKVRAKLTESQVLAIRRLSAQGCPTRELATRFGVSSQNVNLVVSRKTWRYLEVEVEQRDDSAHSPDGDHGTQGEPDKSPSPTDGTVASLVVVATLRHGETETRVELRLSDLTPLGSHGLPS